MSYAGTSLKAIQLISQKNISPLQAWDQAVKIEFLNSRSSQEKSCPKNAFLGLCESGHIKEIKPGRYTGSVSNKRYAVNAVKLLAANKSKSFTAAELWKEVMKKESDQNKRHNSQMEVVLALWAAGLIEI